MRVLALLAFLTLGASIMSDTATADEKKKRPSAGKKESYTDKVTVRYWSGSRFNNPAADVPAFRTEIKDRTVIYLWIGARAFDVGVKSEITDEKGVVWVVDEIKKGSTFHLCYVTKKPKDSDGPDDE